MGSVSGDFDKLNELAQKLADLDSEENRTELSRSLAEEYRTFMLDCFSQQQSPYGQPWAPTKWRISEGGADQSVLSSSGMLRNAATPQNISASGFQITTGVKYATTHQYGATIVPKNAKALCFPGPVTYKQTVSKSGRKTTRKISSGLVFAKKVVIPARPFAPLDGIPARLQEEFEAATYEFIKDYFQK